MRLCAFAEFAMGGGLSLEKCGIRGMMIWNIGSGRLPYAENENHLHHWAGL